jgi:hypothetical protein
VRTEKVWWQMLAKDTERQGQREQRGRQEGTNRKTGRGRGGRGGRQERETQMVEVKEQVALLRKRTILQVSESSAQDF